MNPRSRAHRILRHLPRYVAADNPLTPIAGRTEDLGKMIGVYQNPEPEGERIEIWDNGICWMKNGNLNIVMYDDLSSAIIPDEKNSEFLIIATKSDGKMLLPVRGVDGKFRDSLEMLRFFDRVIDDASGRSS